MKSMMLALVLTFLAGMGVQAKTPVGKAGDWANTIAAAGLHGRLYTVESSGALYATAPETGAWQKIGKPDFANTIFLLAGKGKLIAIEKNGSLYLVDPEDGSRRQSGKAGDWANTIAAAVLDGTLYTVESSGALYATTPETGAWKKIGKPDFGGTTHLFALQDQLASLEKDGTLYLINPTDGAWRTGGKAGDWKGALAGAVCNGKLYTVTGAGDLSVADPVTGARKGLARAQYSGTAHLLAVGNQLYAITAAGDLNAVSISAAVANRSAATKSKQAAGSAESNPALAGQLTFKFMGKWKGDTVAFEKDPEFQKQKAANPQMVQGLLGMMQGMGMKVTLDGVTMTVMEQTVGPYKFTALSASGNTLYIENKDGPKAGVKSRIIFHDDKHIQVIEDSGVAMFFKKD